jgi:hypothetical protein
MSCVDGSLFARILFCFGMVVRYSLVSGLFARCLLPLALMVSANKVLFRYTDNYVLDIYQVFPIPGLTGSPSHHIVLTFSKSFQSSSIFTDHTTSPVVICGLRYISSRTMTAQAMRAALFAIATATSLGGFLHNRLAAQQ